ncbi:MAG TPA: hypothetical protein VFD43_09905 [Planctomycetota bacterium]|nr:hypothetical protein [Planctomycetota bacterium]
MTTAKRVAMRGVVLVAVVGLVHGIFAPVEASPVRRIVTGAGASRDASQPPRATARAAANGAHLTSQPPLIPHAETVPTPALFAENRGQVDGSARFVSLFGAPLWITDDGLRLELVPRPRKAASRSEQADDWQDTTPVLGARVFLTFEGAEPSARVVGVEPAPTLAHYFLGNDPERWVTRVPTWGRVRCQGMYPGIDVDVHGTHGRPEYDLRVAPGADLGTVTVRVDGAERLSLESGGTLRIDTAAGPLRQPPPVTWECDPSGARAPLPCRYVLLDSQRYGFEAPRRDASRWLVVDPVLAYATYLGGGDVDNVRDIAVDASGAAVVVGETASPADFPVTPGAFMTTVGDNLNGYIAKLAPSGASLEFATYLGSWPLAGDAVNCVALAANGDLCVAGVAGPNFPTTPNAFDTSPNGQGDMFIARFTPDGSSLLYSTFLGGSSGSDSPDEIALDAQERVCLVGGASADFPMTPNAYQSIKGTSSGVFVRLSSDASSLEYGSFLDGASTVLGMALDSEGRIHCVGVGSSILPVTPGALDTTKVFGEGFVVTMDCDAGTLDYASFLGGNLNDIAIGIAVDANGSRYVVGETESLDFPHTSGAFDPLLNGNYDAFAVKLSPDGSTLEWGTYFGGIGPDRGVDIDILPDGTVGFVGHAGSSNFPVTPDAYDSVFNSQYALFIARLSVDGSTLLYSSMFGGNQGDVVNPSLTLDAAGAIYVGGGLGDTQFPVTPGAFATAISRQVDGYVLKLALEPWVDLGHALAGMGGIAPHLAPMGTLEPGTNGALLLSGAAPASLAYLIVGLDTLDAPFKGGTLVPAPLLVMPFFTQADGHLSLCWASWPPSVPSGAEIDFQFWVIDAGGPAGFSASNAIQAVTP